MAQKDWAISINQNASFGISALMLQILIQDLSIPICDPWQSVEFFHFMQAVPGNHVC